MKYPTIKNKPVVIASSRADWRGWLAENHAKLKEIWLVYYKKHTSKPSLTKAEANKEALCFGWVDSLIQSIDEERYMQKFTPRKPNSIWSELNKSRVKELEAQNLIHPAGQALIDHAKASGEWKTDRGTPKVVETPDIFAEALKNNHRARQTWEGLTPSQRKQILLWISQAKREETRLRRCSRAIKMLTSGQSPAML